MSANAELKQMTDAELERAIRQLELSANHLEWFSRKGYQQNEVTLNRFKREKVRRGRAETQGKSR
jgi:hypothetical protein